jgi:hypothetical protein
MYLYLTCMCIRGWMDGWMGGWVDGGVQCGLVNDCGWVGVGGVGYPAGVGEQLHIFAAAAANYTSHAQRNTRIQPIALVII